jgi:glycosyltransferase involved in cell wall biosynthesis
MKTLIVVPAFNEEKSLTRVIKDLKAHGYGNILVVNDGSQDKTKEIAEKSNVAVATHVVNRGLGAAISTGLAFARENNPDVVVTFDSDGQHKAEDIKKLLAPITNNVADVVVGSRLKSNNKNFPLRRLLPILFSNLATFGLYGLYSTDTTSGLRAFHRRAYQKIKLKSDRMEFSNEFFKVFVEQRLRYKEVPIDPIYTGYSLTNSKQGSELFSSLKLGFKLIFDLLR